MFSGMVTAHHHNKDQIVTVLNKVLLKCMFEKIICYSD